MSAKLDYVAVIQNIIHFENKITPAGLKRSDSVIPELINLGDKFEQSLLLI